MVRTRGGGGGTLAWPNPTHQIPPAENQSREEAGAAVSLRRLPAPHWAWMSENGQIWVLESWELEQRENCIFELTNEKSGEGTRGSFCVFSGISVQARCPLKPACCDISAWSLLMARMQTHREAQPTLKHNMFTTGAHTSHSADQIVTSFLRYFNTVLGKRTATWSLTLQTLQTMEGKRREETSCDVSFPFCECRRGITEHDTARNLSWRGNVHLRWFFWYEQHPQRYHHQGKGDRSDGSLNPNDVKDFLSASPQRQDFYGYNAYISLWI